MVDALNILCNMKYAVEADVIDLSQAKIHVLSTCPDLVRILVDCDREEFLAKAEKIMDKIQTHLNNLEQ